MNMTSSPTVDLETFARTAADTAMRGAADYLTSQGTLDAFRHNAAACERLIQAIRRTVRETLDSALDDAKAAIDAHMAGAAAATFVASMRLAGIAAAKEVTA
jgi:hypothetical protein